MQLNLGPSEQLGLVAEFFDFFLSNFEPKMCNLPKISTSRFKEVVL